MLPDATWQARNRLEANGDGYPDLLPEDAEVTLRRPYAGDGLPPGFAGDQSAVLRFLDRERLRYELTTDLALASRDVPRLDRYTGDPLSRARRGSRRSARSSGCARYVQGGRSARLGGPGWLRLERGCRSAGAFCAGGARPSRALFGERLRYEREAVPVAVLSDRIGFFRGVPGSFGPFGPLEESQRLPPGARLLASAGTGESRRALVVYRTGRWRRRAGRRSTASAARFVPRPPPRG